MMLMHSTLGSSLSCLGLPSCHRDTLLSFPSTAMLVTSTEIATILTLDTQTIISIFDLIIPIIVSLEPHFLRSLHLSAILVLQHRD